MTQAAFYRQFIVTAVGVLGLHGAHAENLADIYATAQLQDPTIKAARANFEARHEIVYQARGVVLPQIRLSGDATRSKIDSDSSDYEVTIEGYSYTASLEQAVFNLQAWYGYQQAEAIDAQAAAELSAAEQDLVLRVASAYFNVLRAAANLRSAQAEEAAIKRQLEQTEQRFEVGLTAITDVHEAQAAYDLTVVVRIQLENQLEIAFNALESITGERYEQLSGLSPSYPVVPAEPAAREPWVNAALESNFSLLSLTAAVEAAERNVSVQKSVYYPTVSLFAQYQREYTDDAPSLVVGGNTFQLQNTDQDTATIGLRLEVPLFSGGLNASRVRQAASEFDAARFNLDRVRLDLVQQTRSLFSLVMTDVERVRARRQALVSAQSALKATEVGYEVGTRNVVDLLQAQRGLYGTQRDLANARYDYVIHMLQLKQAAGRLGPDDVEGLNTWLRDADPVTDPPPA